MEIRQIEPFDLDEGAMMDYSKGQFTMIIKDVGWSDYERKALKRNKVHLYFVQKEGIMEFLLQVDDAIETCDFPFAPETDSPRSLFEPGEGYVFNIYLIDQDQFINAERKITMSKKDSLMIASALQTAVILSDEEYSEKLEHLQANFEPFELETSALVHAIF